MPNSPILPRSVQIVFEDRPLLRIREGDNDSVDYELNLRWLPAIAKQALTAYSQGRHYYEVETGND